MFSWWSSVETVLSSARGPNGSLRLPVCPRWYSASAFQRSRTEVTEANPTNFHLSVSGFLADIDRMQLEVREYLSLHPADSTAG